MCCRKSFEDLQLKPVPCFPHSACFPPWGERRELVSRFRKRLDVFLGRLYRSHAGMMSINTCVCACVCAVPRDYITAWEFLKVQ